MSTRYLFVSVLTVGLVTSCSQQEYEAKLASSQVNKAEGIDVRVPPQLGDSANYTPGVSDAIPSIPRDVSLSASTSSSSSSSRTSSYATGPTGYHSSSSVSSIFQIPAPQPLVVVDSEGNKYCRKDGDDDRDDGNERDDDNKLFENQTILICHIPPGNLLAPKDKLISFSAWRAHAGHGDHLGACAVRAAEDADDVRYGVCSAEHEYNRDND